MKFGRKPPKNAKALKLSSILSDQAMQGTLFDAPDTVDYGVNINDWKVLGNDDAGDCAAVGWANSRHAVTSALTTPNYPNQDMVWKVYQSQNPNFVPGNGPHGYGSADDQGMEMQTLQEYLHTTGGADGIKSVAFAKVDFRNLDELDAAIALFGGVHWGFDVSYANEVAFSKSLPWDYVKGSQMLGGHATYGIGYKQGFGQQFITWGKETAFTDRFLQYQVEECWVTIWPEHLQSKTFLEGIDINKLKEQYKLITGDDLPVPVEPAPITPVPAVAPFPGANDKVAAHIASVAAKRKQTVTEYQNAHWTNVFRLWDK